MSLYALSLLYYQRENFTECVTEHSDLLTEKQLPALSAIAKPQSKLATSSKGNGNAAPGYLLLLYLSRFSTFTQSLSQS